MLVEKHIFCSQNLKYSYSTGSYVANNVVSSHLETNEIALSNADIIAF